MTQRNPHRKLRPAPRLIMAQRSQVAHCLRAMEESAADVTEAMRDPYCRKEMKELVYDLASLVQVILDETPADALRAGEKGGA